MTIKRLSEILPDETREIFGEKVQLGKFSTESEKFVANRGKSKTGGNASLPRGDGRP